MNIATLLEEYVLESEELQEDITDKITRIQTFIELQGPKSQESGSHLADQPRPVCVFCKGVHPTYACETVMEYKKRL